MRVLSLFDGISCGRIALERVGVPVEVYYASEIEPNAIKVTQSNYPDTTQIGDVTKINFHDYVGKVDIVIGGSPCQGFSVCGKQLAFNDERSALIKYFFEAIEVIRPKYFLLENVVMQKRYEKISVTFCMSNLSELTLPLLAHSKEFVFIGRTYLMCISRSRYQILTSKVCLIGRC